jgi:hypothetical protein
MQTEWAGRQKSLPRWLEGPIQLFSDFMSNASFLMGWMSKTLLPRQLVPQGGRGGRDRGRGLAGELRPEVAREEGRKEATSASSVKEQLTTKIPEVGSLRPGLQGRICAGGRLISGTMTVPVSPPVRQSNGARPRPCRLEVGANLCPGGGPPRVPRRRASAATACA